MYLKRKLSKERAERLHEDNNYTFKYILRSFPDINTKIDTIFNVNFNV